MLSVQYHPTYANIPSSTRTIPEWPFVALPHVDLTTQALVTEALMNITRTMAIAVQGQYTRFIPPANNWGIEQMLTSLGLVDPVTNQCVDASDLYNVISCPQGMFKLSRAEVANGCAAAGLTRPFSPSAPAGYNGTTTVCICKPCRQVPASQVVLSVALAGSAAATPAAAANSTGCTKLTQCGAFVQQNVVTVSVYDAYGSYLRGLLGLPLVASVSVAARSPADVQAGAAYSYTNATVVNATATYGVWQLSLPVSAAGYYQISVLVNGAELSVSPTVISVAVPSCPGVQARTRGDGRFPCILSQKPLQRPGGEDLRRNALSFL